MKMTMSVRHRRALQYALSILTSKYYNEIDAVILYGSCARGEQRYHSDIDLLVIAKSLTPRQIRKMKLDVISDDYHLPDIELRVTDGTFANSLMGKNIRKDGKLLWKK